MKVELVDYIPSPEITYFTFAIEGVSNVCSHQLARHKTTSFSQQSQNCEPQEMEYVVPKSIRDSLEEVWSKDAQMVVQVIHAYVDAMTQLRWLYHDLVVFAGIPEEDARYILPNACCTNITVTMDAHELCHFLSHCYREGTQWEIRKVSEMMLKLAKEVAPTLFF